MANGSETQSKRLPKPRVAGSNPVARSTNPQVYQGCGFVVGEGDFPSPRNYPISCGVTGLTWPEEFSLGSEERATTYSADGSAGYAASILDTSEVGIRPKLADVRTARVGRSQTLGVLLVEDCLFSSPYIDT